MRASEFLNEDNFGVGKKRPARPGSREDQVGPRGHKPETQYSVDEEFEIDEAGKAPKKLCLSKKTDGELGASQLSSCQAQGLRKRNTKRKFRIGKKVQSIDGKYVRSADYGGPLPKWKGN
jgi:hypothetical protein